MPFPRLLAVLSVLVFSTLLASCGGGDPLPQRKNATQLSGAERAEFVAALLRMKTLPSQFEPKLNAYRLLRRSARARL